MDNSTPNSKLDPSLMPLSMCSKICLATYIESDSKDGKHKIWIADSPIGEFQGPLYANLIYAPGLINGIKKGNVIYVLVDFVFDNRMGKIVDFDHNCTPYILGLADLSAVIKTRVDHPNTSNPGDYNYTHPVEGHGLVCDTQGHLILSSQSAYVKMVLRAFGNGLDENMFKVFAQNHSRIISGSGNSFPAREHFGLFTGSDALTKAAAANPKNKFISFRRFVPSNVLPEDWVSTCEGTWAPWVGPNLDKNDIKDGKDILFTKIINKGKKRLTIDAGDPGDGFFSVRVDSVQMSETDIAKRTTPAILQNKFKLKVGDDGAFKISVGGKGIAPAGTHACIIEINPSGDVSISTKGAVEIDADKSIDLVSDKISLKAYSSISLESKEVKIKGTTSTKIDGKEVAIDGGGAKMKLSGSAADFTAKGGFKVNGKSLVTEEFLAWMDKSATMFTLTTGLGAPAAINPAVLPEFKAGTAAPGKFKTDDAVKAPYPPAVPMVKLPKLHLDTELYRTV